MCIRDSNLIAKVRLKDRKVILQEFDYALDMNNPYHNQKQALKRLNQFINKWSKIYPSIGRMFLRKENTLHISNFLLV